MNITKNLKVFFDLMYERNLIQTISKPTRVGKKSTTTIDNIITDYASTCNFYRSYSKKKKKKKMMDRRSNVQKLDIYTKVTITKKI